MTTILYFLLDRKEVPQPIVLFFFFTLHRYHPSIKKPTSAITIILKWCDCNMNLPYKPVAYMNERESSRMADRHKQKEQPHGLLSTLNKQPTPRPRPRQSSSFHYSYAGCVQTITKASLPSHIILWLNSVNILLECTVIISLERNWQCEIYTVLIFRRNLMPMTANTW